MTIKAQTGPGADGAADAPPPGIVVTPLGEVIALNAPIDLLAEQLNGLRALRDGIRTVEHAIRAEVLARMDRDASYTRRAGGWVIEGDGPGRVEYDGLELYNALKPFVLDDVISEDAQLAAVKTVTEWKVQAGGVNKLRRLGGDIEASIAAVARPTSRPRSVRVKEIVAR